MTIIFLMCFYKLIHLNGRPCWSPVYWTDVGENRQVSKTVGQISFQCFCGKWIQKTDSENYYVPSSLPPLRICTFKTEYSTTWKSNKSLAKCWERPQHPYIAAGITSLGDERAIPEPWTNLSNVSSRSWLLIPILILRKWRPLFRTRKY